EEIQCISELGILFLFLRDVSRAAGILTLAVLEVAAKARFAARLAGLGRLLHLLGEILLDNDVRIDALGLDGAAGRRVIPGGGETDRAVRAERDDRLHRSLAEGARADDQRALMVLQCASNDFRSRSRAAVDQHDQLLLV